MEERERADTADRVYLARLHRELAQQLDRRADECEAGAEQFDALAEKASQVVKNAAPSSDHPPKSGEVT